MLFFPLRRLGAGVFLPLSLCFCVSTAWGQASESPGTVARGSWLLESDLLSLVQDRYAAENSTCTARGMSWGNVLLTKGLSEHLDLQVGFDGWLRDDPGTGEAVHRGHGDGVLRIKWNFYGQDGESFAVSLLPMLRLPLASEGLGARRCEPGLLVPWSQPLGNDWVWGGMLGLDSSSSESDSWSVSWLGNAYLGRSFGKRLGCYCEGVGYCSFRAPRVPSLQLGAGLTYTVTKPLTLELAVYRGLNSSTPDWNPVFRISYEF